MKVGAGNVYARVLEASARERDIAWKYLSADIPGAKRTQAFKAGRWDGREHFLEDDQFPTGFLRPLHAELARAGFPLEILDMRVRRPPLHDVDIIDWLRPYQLDAVDAFLPRTRGVVMAPTGSGKTEIIVALSYVIGRPTLVLVDSRDLMHNMADRWEKRVGTMAGRCGDGQWKVEAFTVATFQGIDLQDGRARDLVQGAQVLVVDEVQVLPAAENFKIAMAAVNAYWRLGVSATPTGRMDGRDHRVVAAIGPLVHKIPIAPLVEDGSISTGVVRFVKYVQDKGSGSFGEVYEALVVLSERRNRLVVELARRAARPTLVFVKIEKHGKLLERMLRDAGMRAEFVWGKTQTGGRRAAIKGLEHGNLDVLVCGKIFNKGVDIPSLRSAINAAAGRSAHDAIQRLGRLQRADGDKTFTYYDVDDAKSRWLSKHALERKAAYRESGYVVEEFDALSALGG